MKQGKGIWYALVPHVIGTIIAVVLGWFLPAWIPVFDPVRPAQYALAVAAGVWGLWKLREILAGKDELARRTAKHFDSK